MSLSRQPKKSSYTNKDLVERLEELHSCIHAVDRKLDGHVDIVGKTFTVLRADISHQGGKLEVIERLLIHSSAAKADKKTGEMRPGGFFAKLKNLTPVEAAITAVALVAGGGQSYKFIVAVLSAADHFLRTTH